MKKIINVGLNSSLNIDECIWYRSYSYVYFVSYYFHFYEIKKVRAVFFFLPILSSMYQIKNIHHSVEEGGKKTPLEQHLF